MEEKDKLSHISIKVDKESLKAELHRVLIEATNAVFIGLASIDKLEEVPDFIMGEDKFMMHSPFLIKMDLNESKAYYRNWIIKKGFEDIIKGVSLMLIDICKVIRKREKIYRKNPQSREELKKIVYEKDHKILREHLPKLLEIIKPLLSDDLKYLDEINSINRIRRCLVHRDGIVTKIDSQNESHSLELKYIERTISYEENGNKQAMQPYLLLTGQGRIHMEEKRVAISFEEGSRVSVTYQVFNELIWTAFQFAEDLVSNINFDITKK